VTFVYVLALAVGLLAVAPYLAHHLRRRRAEERDFAPAHLVDPAPPRARSRSKLEDRALFATRIAAVAGLALLGASPLVRCSRLSLSRSSGASVAMAIVIDDSMSMRATLASPSGITKLGASTRFERAREGARQLLASTREGDAVAVVLAGKPARVALAATAELAAARAVVDSAVPSDRGTDLDGAIAIARGLLSEMPQVDKRVIVLSDLADGHPNAPPVGKDSELPIWIPLPELREPATDCGILSADRAGARIRVKVACSLGTPTIGREVAILEASKVVAHVALGTARTEEVSIELSPDDARRTDLVPLVARLSGSDSIAADDVAPVVAEAGPGSVAVISDAADETTATGGAPVVEQALSALELDVAARPLPAVPDRLEDLTPFLGVIVDDPPGFTPEERRALGSYVECGGALLLALGPHAASAPLGASLEPIVPHAVTWEPTASRGVDLKTASSLFGESAQSGADLDAARRAVFVGEDLSLLRSLLKWSDGAPLLARRALGRGEAWIVTLPFGVEASDLPLRPLFLALLDTWTTEARARTSPKRTDAGVAWTFPGAHTVEAEGPEGPVPVIREGAEPRVVPALLGLYRLTIDGKKEARVAAPVEAEIDMRPRAAADTAGGKDVGDSRAAVDASPALALGLLVLMALELALRLRARTREIVA
jgi:von Willebrand factor type A domain/Aerotolerance regulator N-terminal